MSNFYSDQDLIHRRLKRAMAGPARVFGPRKTEQESVHPYAAAGNLRPPTRRAYASERERRAEQKWPFMDGY